MALDVSKTSTFHNGVGPSVMSNNSSGQKNVDAIAVSTTYPSPEIKLAKNLDLNHKGSLNSEEYIKSEIEKVNSRLKPHNIRCEFGYHEETNRVTIRIMDKDTEEVIREIPPEKTLDMIQKMWELAGLLIDERR